MARSIHFRTVWITLFCLLLSTASLVAIPGTSYTDGFEGTVINPYWTLVQGYGSIALSTEQAHSGTQSVKFTSSDGGQRNMVMTHTMGARTKGKVSVWFYDVAPGQETLYEGMRVYSSVRLEVQ